MSPSAPPLVPVPALALVPAGWFWMGCATGQDNERPVHRVWVDAFQIALRQVTNADYARFLAETSTPHRPLGPTPTSAIRASRWFRSRGLTQPAIAIG